MEIRTRTHQEKEGRRKEETPKGIRGARKEKRRAQEERRRTQERRRTKKRAIKAIKTRLYQ